LRPASLSVAQRRFQEGVLERATARAAAMILPSRTLRAEQRLAIYVDAYMARLVEALEKDFPAVARLLGHRAFHRLCRGYLEAHPSRCYSLNPLGRKLPVFMAPGAARDVARVEAAMSEVFDAEAAEPLRPEDFGKIAPEKVAGLRLAFVPTFRLLALDHDVNGFIDAVRQDRKSLPPLRRRPAWVAVYRKEFQVRRLDLKDAAHAALSALDRGRTVGQAVGAAAMAWTGKPGDLEPQIRRWFGEWTTEGFFARIVRRLRIR
jgi:hypothetical protein